MRQRGQLLHLNKYLHPTHYINNMTFTIYNNKRFVLKEEHFSVGMLVFLFFVFLQQGIIVMVSAFVLFIVRNIIVLLVGWWLGLVLLRFWLIVLALLEKRRTGFRRQAGQICSTEKLQVKFNRKTLI